MKPWIKRYLVFAGTVDHPQGGWDDCCGSFETLDEARAAVAEKISEFKDLHQLTDVQAQTWFDIMDIYDESFHEISGIG